MRQIALILFITGSFFLNGQEAYQFPEKFPSIYYFNPDKAFKSLNAKPLEGLDADHSSSFRIRQIYGAQATFDENRAYLNWGVVENYVMAVFDSVYPRKLRPNRYMEVYVARDAAVNAYAQDNGFMFVNVGLLASLRTEAALAITIAHEIGHALNFHGYNKYADEILFEKNNPNKYLDYGALNGIYSRSYETIADTFAFYKVIRSGYNLSSIRGQFDIFERGTTRMIHVSLPKFTDGYHGLMLDYLKTYGTHPMDKDRVSNAMKIQKKASAVGKNFKVDSVLFGKIRNLANEECKKILFEEADYKECINRCFIDYLYNEKKAKNLYLLVESIRRFLYVTPEKAEKPFLSEEYSDKEFLDYNKSILQKPDLLFLDSIQEADLKTHPLFALENKPFRTYEEAFIYFSDKAKQLGINEANLSQALYYYVKKNEEKFTVALDTYLAGNSKLNEDLALSLKKSGKPLLNGTKTLFVVDNTGMNRSDGPYFNMNYYQSLSKRDAKAKMYPILSKDSSAHKVVFLSDLVGKKPKELYEYQKLEVMISSLFNEDNFGKYEKKRVLAKPTLLQRDLVDNKYNRNVFIFQPELYKWFAEKDCGALCVANISYDFEKPLSLADKKNNYTAYYMNFSDVRPFIRNGSRSTFSLRQDEAEIAADLIDFIYGKE